MNRDIISVFVILVFAIAMFSMNRVRNDIASILIMLSLAWSGILPLNEAFAGFSSNAVIAVMGVMMIGYGIEKTGVMGSLAKVIVEHSGSKKNKITALVMAAAGLISSFLQNIGAVALFLPAVKRIAKRSAISPQRLIMPLAFAGVLGGTMTMVASGPLIVLNDLLSDGGHEGFGLLSVSPIGLCLLASGILYFYFLSSRVLPGGKEENKEEKDDLSDMYNLPTEIRETRITARSGLAGKTIEEAAIWDTHGIHILAISNAGSKTYIPWRETAFKEGQILALYGEEQKLERFLQDYQLDARDSLETFKELEDREVAGFAEIILPPDSGLKGKTLREIALRKNYRIEPVMYVSPEGQRLEMMDQELSPGLKAVVFGRWEDINSLRESNDFIVISDVKPSSNEGGKHKKIYALVILGAAILAILLGAPLPLSFFSALILMLLSGVIRKEEMYKAIDWKTVFLLAGLIPLGTAFEKTGAAEWTAAIIIGGVETWPVFVILLVIGAVTSLFSMFMSNVAAAVLLVPMVLLMGEDFGIDARGLALFVAVSASNSFIIPTHQVNAYVMGPGGYKTTDYMKAGSIMSLIFLLVSSGLVYLFYI